MRSASAAARRMAASATAATAAACACPSLVESTALVKPILMVLPPIATALESDENSGTASPAAWAVWCRLSLDDDDNDDGLGLGGGKLSGDPDGVDAGDHSGSSSHLFADPSSPSAARSFLRRKCSACSSDVVALEWATAAIWRWRVSSRRWWAA